METRSKSNRLRTVCSNLCATSICTEPFKIKSVINWIGCDICDHWFHFDCVVIPDSEYENTKQDDFVYICKSCNANAFNNANDSGREMYCDAENIENNCCIVENEIINHALRQTDTMNTSELWDGNNMNSMAGISQIENQTRQPMNENPEIQNSQHETTINDEIVNDMSIINENIIDANSIECHICKIRCKGTRGLNAHLTRSHPEQYRNIICQRNQPEVISDTNENPPEPEPPDIEMRTCSK